MTAPDKLEVSKKLYLLVLLLSVFIILIGWYGNNELKNIHRNTQTLYKDRVFPIVELTNLRFIYGAHILATARQAKNGEISFETAEKKIQEAQRNIASQWNDYHQAYLTPEEAFLVADIKADRQKADLAIRQLELLLAKGDEQAVGDFVNKEFHDAIYKVIFELDALVKIQVKIAGDIYQNSGKVYSKTTERFYIITVVCLGFAAVFSFVIVQNVKTIINNLKDSENKYRNIFENVQDIFYQTSADGYLMELSPSVETVLGYTREELINTATTKLYYDPNDREQVISLLRQQGNLLDHEIRFRSKSGQLVYGLLSVNVTYKPDGSIRHVDGVFKNITNRVQGEEKLKRSEARLKEAQAIAHMGNWDIDFINNTHTWSDEVYHIYGMDKEQVKPSTEALLAFVHPADRADAETELKETFKSLKDSSSHFRFIRSDGTERYGFIEWKFELDEHLYASRVYGILQDVTERKRAEYEREKMLTDIIQRNKIFEQFSYIVSHNLRGPVANILGISEALKNSPDEERNELQQHLFESVGQLDEIIKTLNEILKIRNVSTEAKEFVHFPELIDTIKSDLLALPRKGPVTVNTAFEIDKVYTLKSALRNIFYKLIANSIKYQQPGIDPVITIKNEMRNGRLRITFKDNGLGLDLEKFGKKIFGISQRFHLNVQGKGIGLFLVKAQVELLGGNIDVKSAPNEGTEFILELPMK